MKNLWIIVFVVALGFTARATPLDDKIKSFADALKTTDAAKSAVDPMMAARMPAMAMEFRSSALAQGNEANLEAMVKQMMVANPSEAVQKAGKALLAELETQKKARADALKAKVNEILARVPEILIKAKKTQELDGILGNLQKAQVPQGGMYGYDPESQAVTGQVTSAYQFVAQWQDYLSARNSGNIQEAQNALRNLLNSRPQGETMLVPRSEILARTVELATQLKNASPSASPSTSPAALSAVDIAPILNGIKTLDDMEPALKALRIASNNQNSDVAQLAQLTGLYAAAKNGLLVTLELTAPNYTNINPDPGFERIKSMLLIYLLPRFIGSDALTPNSNETVSDYLKRSIEAAQAKQDLTLLQRIVVAETRSAKVTNVPQGTHSFLAGLNQDMAGQYAQAVTSYQNALDQPDDFLPLKVVADRLAAIKKDHPAEFDEGMKRILNPPAPVYANPYMMRPGYGYPMPGYPNPAPVATPSPAAAPATNAAPAPAPPPVSTNAAPATPTPTMK